MPGKKLIKHGPKQPRTDPGKRNLVDLKLELHAASKYDGPATRHTSIHRAHSEFLHCVNLGFGTCRPQARIKTEQFAQCGRPLIGAAIGQC